MRTFNVRRQERLERLKSLVKSLESLGRFTLSRTVQDTKMADASAIKWALEEIDRLDRIEWAALNAEQPQEGLYRIEEILEERKVPTERDLRENEGLARQQEGRKGHEQ